MARLKGAIEVVGNLGGLSYYTRKGSEEIIVRSKGGPTKAMIKKSPKFAGMRLQQNEWRGCTSFASKLRYSFGTLFRLADYNLTPTLNALAKNIQKTDENNELGKRSIVFSAHKHSLQGFNFNNNYPFNTVLRVAPVVEIDRDNLSTSVKVPRINVETELLNIQRLPYFRLLVSLGAVSDVKLKSGIYQPVVDELHGISQTYTSDWFTTSGIIDEQEITVKLDEQKILLLSDDVTLVVSMAVEFGKAGFTGQPEAVKYAGCGKVLACG